MRSVRDSVVTSSLVVSCYLHGLCIYTFIVTLQDISFNNNSFVFFTLSWPTMHTNKDTCDL